MLDVGSSDYRSDIQKNDPLKCFPEIENKI